MIRPVIAVFAVVATLMSGVTAATATSGAPAVGKWHGDGMTFRLTADEHGTRHVTDLRFHHFTSFGPTTIRDGHFATCAHAHGDRLCVRGHVVASGDDQAIAGTATIEIGFLPPLPVGRWHAVPVS
ncbi:hypothetical protein ABLE68_00815 [Nocardioides sp. CN2-186]|uniref:hypothetical protein n=1 Tax=Nocardioides tweenelious TaxID=3156607 RepID=UPI0032B4914D